ncbi:ferredoxin [Lachnospiraceae bacterium KM106-2]|nr:ferredoxin [Lachnospiraceae bacterium KM106-2]
MVLYFTGTGNSRYAARIIAEEAQDELVSINELMKKDFHGTLTSTKPFVVVSPIYAWRMPRVVEKFLREVTLDGSREIYVLVTCESQTGNAVTYVKELCQELSMTLKGFTAFYMPENYILMYPEVKEEQAKASIEKITPRIHAVGKEIAENKAIPIKKPTIIAKMQTGLVNPIFYRLLVKAKGFHTTEKCTGCGKCENLCPLNNIRLIDGRPIWGDDCTHCVACISGCPSEAIEYKKKTQGKSRYYVK